MNNKNSKIIVGLTGYLGSGKTTALEYFKEAGFYTIDADKIVHNLYKEGNSGWKKIKDFFGEEYIDKKTGDVNRDALRKVVFKNPAKLNILEKLIHPLVFNELRCEIKNSPENNIAIEAVLFDEKKLGNEISYTVWIELDHKTAFDRFNTKRNMTFDDYMKIVNHQKKPEKIDFVIENSGSKSELKEKVLNVANAIISQTP